MEWQKFKLGIYQHYKGNYYRAKEIVFTHEDQTPYIVYYQCDKDGIFQSIRNKYNREIIIAHQPFIRKLEEWNQTIIDPDHTTIRFKLIKEL
jgi:hypothetical protein